MAEVSSRASDDWIHPNFTFELIQRLNEQQCNVDSLFPRFHPLTCANRGDGQHGREGGDLGLLVATPDGWICPHCGYTQTLTYAPMLEARSDPVLPLLSGAFSQQEIESFHTAQRERVARYIQQFTALITSRRRSADQSDEENATTQRIWCVAGVMRAALLRRQARFFDVDVRFSDDDRLAGPVPVPGSSWTRTERGNPGTYPSAEEEVEVILFKMTRSLTIAGFGSGAEYGVRSTHLLPNSETFMATVVEGGEVVAWRKRAT
jgi:hypothetical protein